MEPKANARPEAFAPARRYDSMILNSAARMVAGYVETVKTTPPLGTGQAAALELTEDLTAALYAEGRSLGEHASAMTPSQRWEAVGAALFALDNLEAFGGLAPRARYQGQGRFGLTLEFHAARFLIATSDTAEGLARQRLRLESYFGASFEDVGYLTESHPTRM